MSRSYLEHASQYHADLIKLGVKNSSHIYVSDRQTQVLLNLLLSRPPQDRYILTFGDLRTCASGLIAEFCHVCEFTLDWRANPARLQSKDDADEQVTREEAEEIASQSRAPFYGEVDRFYGFWIPSPCLLETVIEKRVDDFAELFYPFCEFRGTGRMFLVAPMVAA